jgi:hypothetical protein
MLELDKLTKRGRDTSTMKKCGKCREAFTGRAKYGTDKLSLWCGVITTVIISIKLLVTDDLLSKKCRE